MAFSIRNLTAACVVLAAGLALPPEAVATWSPRDGAGLTCVSSAEDNDFTGANRFLIDAGIQARLFNATTSAFYGVGFVDAGIQTSDGGGLGMTRPAAYNCSGVVNGVPCLANPYGIVEIYGSLPVAQTTPYVCAVELYQYNDLGASADTCVMGIGVGATSTKIVRFTGDGSLHLGGSIRMEEGRQISGPPSSYMELQPRPAANGVGVYVSAVGGGLAAGGTMLALYNPAYASTNVFEVAFDGTLATTSARTKGTVFLTDGTASVTVAPGATCTCATVGRSRNPCSQEVHDTTLSLYGTGSEQVSWLCL